MLSALAKYIFGGVMGDAPETTPMQYETREMNDWLLVDMPVQAIDDEDMDSESDDDDILSAVPLLMDEEALAYPKQIVLSYEANSVCDNTYGKARKDFRDKIHSASSKVQVHSGDKIQGNFLKNIETLSVENEDKSQVKAHTNSTKLQENSKSKRSKSKKSKSTKRFRKNKTQDSKDVKIKDMPTAAEENIDNVRENSNDVQNYFHEVPQSVESEMPDSSVNGKTNNVSKTDDFVVPEQENSIDVFQDADANFHDNKVQEYFDKTQQEAGHDVTLSNESRNLSATDDIEVQNLLCNDGLQKSSDDQVTFEGKIQGIALGLKANSSKPKKVRSKAKRFRKNKIQNSKDVKIKEMPTAAEENIDHVQEDLNDVQKDFYETTQSVKCEIPDSSVNKSSDASKIEDILVSGPENSIDVFVDADSKFQDKKVQDFDKEIKYSSNETNVKPGGENAEVSLKLALSSGNITTTDDAQKLDNPDTLEGKIQGNSLELKGNSSKSKKLRCKKSRKSRTQYKSYKKIQSTLELPQGDCTVQENTNDTDNNIQVIPSEVVSNLDDASNGECNHEIMDVCVNEDENTEDFLKDIMESFYEFQENIDKKMLFTPSEVQYDACDVVQDAFSNEEISKAVFENSKDQLHNTHDLENKDIDILENNNHEFLEKSAEVPESTTSISDEAQYSSTKYQNNFTEDAEVDQEEQFQSKIQDVYSKDMFHDSDDLEGFSDLWDIYTKFNDDYDEEVIEISDEEMDEHFSVEIQASDNEMDESSDNENYSATDDDLSEDSYLNDTERRLMHLANTGNWKFNSKFVQRFLSTAQEESDEESDDNAFMGPKNYKLNSTVSWPVKNYYYNPEKRKQETHRVMFTYTNKPQKYELTESFTFEPEHSFASQSLYYPSSYAIAIAQLQSDLQQSQKDCPQKWIQSNASTQKHKKRTATKKQAANNATTEPSVMINTELQNFINQLKPTLSVLPTKSAVVLEHVKELKPVQQAIQFEARKYLTRSQLNRQNRNYIYQSSVKTNRRKNLQRNPSGANNNRKCY